MYEKFLENKSIFWNFQTVLFIIAFFTIRLLSFFLTGHNILQSVVVFIIIMVFAILYYKNQHLAWAILVAEFLLDGAGHFFEFFGLSLRTMLFGTFISLWFVQTAFNTKAELKGFPKKLIVILSLLAIFLLMSSTKGLIAQHGAKTVIQDLLPFLLLILIFPGYHVFKDKKIQKLLIRLLIAFIISSAIFALFTFVLFSSGVEQLQSPYYKWFRDVAMGKVTNMGQGFWRIVLPEHLLFVPLTLLITSLLMRNEKHHKFWWLMLCLSIMILVLNFSRIYILALLIGLLVLKYKHSYAKWFFNTTAVGLIFLSLFVSINFIASGGGSAGLDLLGLRVGSLYQPETELSSFTRMTLLEPIGQKIRQNLLFGSGLGSTITFQDPIYYQTITTRHYDWGYLELLAELGLFGFISFLALIFYVIFSLIKKIRLSEDYHDFYVGLLAGIVALTLMNIAAPILFHTIGVIFLVFVIILSTHKADILEVIVKLLYQTFHKLKNK